MIECFIAGITYENRQEFHKTLWTNRERLKDIKYALSFKREPTNKFDANAIGIYLTSEELFGTEEEKHLGYIPKTFSTEVSNKLKASEITKVTIAEVIDDSFGKAIYGTKLLIETKETVVAPKVEEPKPDQELIPVAPVLIEPGTVKKIELKDLVVEEGTEFNFTWDRCVWIAGKPFKINTKFTPVKDGEKWVGYTGTAQLELVDVSNHSKKKNSRVRKDTNKDPVPTGD